MHVRIIGDVPNYTKLFAYHLIFTKTIPQSALVMATYAAWAHVQADQCQMHLAKAIEPTYTVYVQAFPYAHAASGYNF